MQSNTVLCNNVKEQSRRDMVASKLDEGFFQGDVLTEMMAVKSKDLFAKQDSREAIENGIFASKKQIQTALTETEIPKTSAVADALRELLSPSALVEGGHLASLHKLRTLRTLFSEMGVKEVDDKWTEVINDCSKLDCPSGYLVNRWNYACSNKELAELLKSDGMALRNSRIG